MKRMYGVHTWVFAAFRSAQPSCLLMESWSSARLLFAHGPEVLTSLHTNIPISRAPLNYAGERESPISLATQQQQLMACVAVRRVTAPLTLLTQSPSQHALGLTVINVPGHLFSGHYFQSKRRWKLPGTFEPRGLEFRTECQTPDLVGPAPVALYNRLRTSRANESNVPSSVRTMLLWYVTSTQLHPCSLTVFTKREQRQAQHLEGWQRLRQHRAPGDHDKWDKLLGGPTSEQMLWVCAPEDTKRHSMQARLPVRSVLLPQSCVGGANVPSLWRTSALLQDRCQCHSAPSTGCWPSASLRFRMAATRE